MKTDKNLSGKGILYNCCRSGFDFFKSYLGNAKKWFV